MKSEKSTIRRLLLAKQLFLHGIEHSYRNNPLDKMIAVHNLHNALEITLRAIILTFEIRTEKELNIEFETMMSEISQSPAVRDKGIRFSYRQELRNLNNLRNLVQHHGHEPEASSMEDWRVFTKRFLHRTYVDFFGIQFQDLTITDFVDNEKIRAVLKIAENYLKQSKWVEATYSAKYAFEIASLSLRDVLPANSVNSEIFAFTGFSHPYDLGALNLQPLEDAIRTVYSRIKEVELFSLFVSSGISAADFKRFEEQPPHVFICIGGTLAVQCNEGRSPVSEEEARWIVDFCSTAILNWQIQGMKPSVNDYIEEGVSEWISERAPQTQPLAT